MGSRRVETGSSALENRPFIAPFVADITRTRDVLTAPNRS